MNYKNRGHFSNKLEFNISKLPTKKTDRAAFFIFLPGLFFASLLIAIGAYELFNGFNVSKTVFDDINLNAEYTSTMTSPIVFDLVLIAIGLWIVWSLFLSYIQYKKIGFDGHVFTITHRPAWGRKTVLRESAENYVGVRFRVEFYQHGLVNRNRYIVELYHEDEDKIIPLYITTKKQNFSEITLKYARFFNKPIIYVTSQGTVFRKHEDFNRPLMENKKVALSQICDDVVEPDYIKIKEVKDKIIIKVGKALFDAYNLIAATILIVFGSLLFFLSTVDYEKTPQTVGLHAFAVFSVFIAFVILFRRDKIVIKKDKVIVVHKFWLFSKKYDEMKKADIVWISIANNPALDRNFLIIYSAKDSMVFGKKLPINDLMWVKNLLIEEIVK